MRLIDSGVAPGDLNMAIDLALAESVARGAEPTVRLYRWSPPCLSFGRNQPAAGRFDARRVHALGIEIVRRPTGGRAVLHDRELTYCVALADRWLGGPRETYFTINRALVEGVRRLGVPATLSERGERAPRLTAGPCFDEAIRGEVVVNGRKLVGSAQVRTGGAILQHGSLLLGPSAHRVGEFLLGDGIRPELAASLEEAIPTRPTWEALVVALASGFSEVFGVPVVRGGLTSVEQQRADVLRRTFSDPAWTWRH